MTTVGVPSRMTLEVWPREVRIHWPTRPTQQIHPDVSRLIAGSNSISKEELHTLMSQNKDKTQNEDVADLLIIRQTAQVHQPNKASASSIDAHELNREVTVKTTTKESYGAASPYSPDPQTYSPTRERCDQRVEIVGVFGIFHLQARSYLAVVTKQKLIALWHGNAAFNRIEKVQFIPLPFYTENTQDSKDISSTPLQSSVQEGKQAKQNDQIYLSMLRSIFAKQAFLSAQNYEITHTVQRQTIFALVEQGVLPRTALPLLSHDAQQMTESDVPTTRRLRAPSEIEQPTIPTAIPQATLFGYKDPNITWLRADPRFTWNRHLLEPFFAANAQDFAVCAMNGFIKCIRQVPIATTKAKEDTMIDILFISRRSCRRQGTRFNVRGIDESGEVANFVETEQIVVQYSADAADTSNVSTSFDRNSTSMTNPSICEENERRISSFVQTRGSIPLLWSQTPTMKYTPKVHIGRNQTQSHVLFERHFKQQFRAYGQVVAINLIDRKKDQHLIGTSYNDHAKQLADPRLIFEWFDFHKECAKMKWSNLSKLIGKIQTELDDVGHFEAILTPSKQTYTKILPNSTTTTNISSSHDMLVAKWQHGVVRTNCMDNLDRTNVVQSLLARRAALSAIPGAHVPDATQGENVLDSPYKAFEHVFKNLWADNADAMSFLYSGTGALKTDFTRTGKRSIQGAMNDGINSLERYYINNMMDGRNQDAWDLFLGRFCPATPSGVTPVGLCASDDVFLAHYENGYDPLSLHGTNLTATRDFHGSNIHAEPCCTPTDGIKAYQRDLSPGKLARRAMLTFMTMSGVYASIISSFFQMISPKQNYSGFLRTSISSLVHTITSFIPTIHSNPTNVNHGIDSNNIETIHNSRWWAELNIGMLIAALCMFGATVTLIRQGKPKFLANALLSRPHFIKHDLVHSDHVEKDISTDLKQESVKFGVKTSDTNTNSSSARRRTGGNRPIA